MNRIFRTLEIDGKLVRAFNPVVLVELLDSSRSIGSTAGREHAYTRVLADLEERRKAAEEELDRAPADPVVIGTIIAYSQLIARYSGEPDMYRTQWQARGCIAPLLHA